MTLIGISGKKRSGKNTVAKLINCNLGNVHEIASPTPSRRKWPTLAKRPSI